MKLGEPYEDGEAAKSYWRHLGNWCSGFTEFTVTSYVAEFK